MATYVQPKYGQMVEIARNEARNAYILSTDPNGAETTQERFFAAMDRMLTNVGVELHDPDREHPEDRPQQLVAANANAGKPMSDIVEPQDLYETGQRLLEHGPQGDQISIPICVGNVALGELPVLVAA